MKADVISKSEALYAILTGLISEITLYMDTDEDIYNGFHENYILNKDRLIQETEYKIYYPSDADRIVFKEEARKLFRMFIELRNKEKLKYNSKPTIT